jgi:hypothetical protein
MKVAANKRARAEAERIAAAAAGNLGGHPDAPPVVPPAAAAAALPPAGQVLIGAAALAQILAAVQHPPHLAVAGAPLPERAGSTRLKAFSSTEAIEWMSWKTHCGNATQRNATQSGKTHGRRRPCLRCRPGRQPACPDHYLAGPNRKVPREVYAARCWRVLPRGVQHS